MPEAPPAIDAFFTITENGRETGFITRGGRAARFDWDTGRMADGARPLERLWPALPAAFRSGFDAVLVTADPWSMVFRGAQCLLLNPLDGSVAEVSTIAARLPGLPQPFLQGIDAALASGAGQEVYLFAGDQCARYDLRAMNVVEVAPLERMWPGLAQHAPAFTAGIDAAVSRPSQGAFHFFHAADSTRGTLATRTVTETARPVDDTTWPGLVPTFAPGFAYVQVGQNIDVIDLESDREVETLDINPHSDSTTALQMSPDGRLLYVWTHTQRLCLDTTTRRIVADLPFASGESPACGVAFSAGASLVHGATKNWEQGRLYLDTFRAGTTERTQRVELRAQDLRAALSAQDEGTDVKADSIQADMGPAVASPDDRFVYLGVDLDGRGAVVEVDVRAGRLRQAFRMPAGNAFTIALSPDGFHLHAAGREGVCTFDVRNGAVVRQGVLPGCTALAVSRGGDGLYCLPWDWDTKEGLLIADPLSHAVRRRIPVGGSGGPGYPHAIAFDYAGTFAFLSEEHANAVVIVDTETYDMVRAIPTRDGRRPMSIAVGPY
ncbi:hemopexin repeat-containing protein [Streptomyces sp. NBC_01443]|uniref:hemopexin repeat-containing protein n=1 Tax=Streptomyces sp. NBC_01443 TaxID=2903868 RepID=UPI002257A5EE|nr:hemopexin repeat-containing protein [Streptomyces sp. NBC_01443]MCX4633450.1 hemopexin repeat-containing protein [Streptomyces sp. NBC_01443]